jgi:molybdopterin synthase sulfur carrier subunit
MKVNFFATLREIVGTKTVEFEAFEGVTIRQLLEIIVERFPALRRELLDEQGQLHGHIHFFVNGRDAPYLVDTVDTVLKPEDVISIFPPVGGG